MPRRLVHGQGEDVRPGVVADRVEVEVPAIEVGEVELREQDALTVAQRSGEDLAQRRDDRAAAVDQHGVVLGQVLVRADHEAAAFECDVPHGRLPLLAVVDRRRAPELRPPWRTWPAGAAACSSPSRSRRPARRPPCDRRQRRAVALAPEAPLGRGRHQLAVVGDQAVVRVEEHRGAVQRPAVPLDHAGDEVDVELSGELGQAARSPARPAQRPPPGTGGTARDLPLSAIRR